MPTIRPATELDFDQIKSEIIDFIKTNPTFSDYNFTGSALNAIVDVLAYNTHTNAYYANMLHNEGFIETAQKRSSVVSRAKELGYTPRSAVCSVAFVNITIPTTDIVDQLYIERGTTFTTVNDNGGFIFSVVDTTPAKVIGSNNTFTNLKLVNGVQATNMYQVDTQSNLRSIFTIPNTSIDTSTLRVFVRDSISAVEKNEYFLADNFFDLTSDSKVYFLQESYNGLFQIYFGDNILGVQPKSSNVIDIDYFVTENFSTSDGCRLFGFEGSIGGNGTINIETSQVSFGGANKEELGSIKFNAIKANSAKGRSVTTSDYVLLLKENFNFIKTVSVWGGEDNLPPVYGKVFISIQPVSGFTISDQVMREVITPVVKSNSLMTIGVEFVDPAYIDLHFKTNIKFNPTKTASSKIEVEGFVKTAISDYITSISTFSKDYLESTLISEISNVDVGIMSVTIDKKVGFKITPLIGVASNLVKYINNEIRSGSILSNRFVVMVAEEEVVVTIREIENSLYSIDNVGGKTTINSLLGLFTDNGVLVKEVGTVDLSNGKFNITLNILSYSNINRFISIQFILTGNDVITTRNQILQLASTSEITSGTNNNTVIVENYGK